MKFLSFNNNDKMPALGLGTWKSEPGEVYKAIRTAIEIGYKHIDCAPIYGNEKEIGQAIQDAIKAGDVSREQLWITSKLWNNSHGKNKVKPALENTLQDLGLDYLDLYLIHWPVAIKHELTFPQEGNDFIGLDEIPLLDTWQGMEDVHASGLTRHIGVSNFSIKKLQTLIDGASQLPELNQIEMHPFLQQNNIVEFCKLHNIHLTGYSPLGSSDRASELKKKKEPSLFEHPSLINIGLSKNSSVAQIVLAWAINRGTSVIPKSVSNMHLQDNLLAANIQLNELQMMVVNNLDKGYRYIDGSFWTPQGSPYTLENLLDEK